MLLTKVAMIRKEGYPIGIKAPVYLNCPCGFRPNTDIDTKEDVTCKCGQVYQYNGWLKKDK